MLIITYLFAALSLFLTLDAAALHLGAAAALPDFTAVAAGIAGFLVAVVWYAKIRATERAKKKRNKTFPAMYVNLGACIAAAGYWLFTLIKELK